MAIERAEARGVVARRHLREWILRRGARGAWRDRRTATLLASAGRRWAGATECLQLAALMHLGAGRPAEAVALFDEAVARGRGGWSSVRFDLGTALMRCGELERAETELLAACRLTGNATWAEYERERCRVMKGLADELGQQIEETERVEADQPGRGTRFSEALRYAIPFLPRGRVETLRALVARRPHATEAMLFLAHVEAEQGNLPRAIELLQAVARRRWPELVQAHGAAAPPGALPRFLVIGQAKAGTTSLFRHLAAHPQVVAPLIKEPHFWALHHRHGQDWYRAFFPPLPADSDLITGEASPSTFTSPEAPGLVARALPDARLILLLRDPVHLAYSHHAMDVRNHHHAVSFETTVARELEHSPTCPLEPRDLPHGYLATSAALPHLRRWLAHVPPERLLILQNRDLADDLPGVMRRVCRHLGIAAFVPPDSTRHNVGSYPPMPEALERRLRAWFAEHDRALAEFLGALPGSHA